MIFDHRTFTLSTLIFTLAVRTNDVLVVEKNPFSFSCQCPRRASVVIWHPRVIRTRLVSSNHRHTIPLFFAPPAIVWFYLVMSLVRNVSDLSRLSLLSSVVDVVQEPWWNGGMSILRIWSISRSIRSFLLFVRPFFVSSPVFPRRRRVWMRAMWSMPRFFFDMWTSTIVEHIDASFVRGHRILWSISKRFSSTMIPILSLWPIKFKSLVRRETFCVWSSLDRCCWLFLAPRLCQASPGTLPCFSGMRLSSPGVVDAYQTSFLQCVVNNFNR